MGSSDTASSIPADGETKVYVQLYFLSRKLTDMDGKMFSLW